MAKTPIYTKKAIANYREKFDFVQVRLNKGEKERIEKIIFPQKLNDYIITLIYNDLEEKKLI